MNPERLRSLLSAPVDGASAPAEKIQLEHALHSSSAARTLFWEETRLHDPLRAVMEESTLPHPIAQMTAPARLEAREPFFLRALFRGPVPALGAGIVLSALCASAVWAYAGHARRSTAAAAGFPIRVNLTGRQVFETPGKNERFKRGKCWIKEDAMGIPSKLWRPYTTIANPPALVDGRYRFRVTGYGLHTNGALLPVTFNHLLSPQLSYGKNLAWRDLPSDTPGVAEVVLNLQQGQVVDIFGWTLQERDMVLRKLKEAPADTWPGPSLVLEHLEIEGPLDT